MAIVELYSKSQKKLRGDVPEIFTYDNLPQILKVQIVFILRDAFQNVRDAENIYFSFHKTLCREYGEFTLETEKNVRNTNTEILMKHFLNTNDIEVAFDVIQLIFGYLYDNIDKMIYNPMFKIGEGTYRTKGGDIVLLPEQAISELNARLIEHGIGYQFESGKIIRVDSTYTHSEITKPTLQLLWNPKFAGANEEYLKAHEHYRHGRNKECLNDCLKSFESTLKIICSEKGWRFSPNDTSRKLIEVCFTNDLIPTFTQNQFTSLQSLIETGIAPIRNKLGGHGQGQTPHEVDANMTRYALNLTGANIIFLIEQSGIK